MAAVAALRARVRPVGEPLDPEDDRCAICFDTLLGEQAQAQGGVVHLPCHAAHRFHLDCLRTHLSRVEFHWDACCPLCRGPMFPERARIDLTAHSDEPSAAREGEGVRPPGDPQPRAMRGGDCTLCEEVVSGGRPGLVAHVRRAHPGATADELSTMDMARCSLMSGCGAVFDRARLPAHEAATGVGSCISGRRPLVPCRPAAAAHGAGGGGRHGPPVLGRGRPGEGRSRRGRGGQSGALSRGRGRA
eukprot:8976784-Pyramimonas_sp.AAC.1